MHILLKEQIIELKDIKINQGKEEENFPCNKINPSINLQLYNNSSKVVTDKLGKNKNIKNLNSRLLDWLRYSSKVAITSLL